MSVLGRITPSSEIVAGSPEVAANIAATNSLIGILRAGVEHPQPVISGEAQWDESLSTGIDPMVGLQMDHLSDPDEPRNSYLLGMREDGVGRIVMLEAGPRGGVGGRVTMTLREGMPTSLSGGRTMRLHTKGGIPYDEYVKLDRPALAEELDALSARLPVLFEARRTRQYGGNKPNRLLPKLGAVLGIGRPPKHAKPRAIEE